MSNGQKKRRSSGSARLMTLVIITVGLTGMGIMSQYEESPRRTAASAESVRPVEQAADQPNRPSDQESETIAAGTDGEAAPAEPARDPGKWQFRTDVSEIDDSQSVTLWVDAEQTFTAWPGREHRARLFVRYREGEIECFVRTGTPPHRHHVRSVPTLTIRFDSEEAEQFTGTRSTDSKALFMNQPKPLIRRIAEAERMVVRFTPLHSSSVTFSFDVRGLEEAIIPLEELSGWRLDDKADILSYRLRRIVPELGRHANRFSRDHLTVTYDNRHSVMGKISPVVRDFIGHLHAELQRDPELSLRITAHGIRTRGGLFAPSERRLTSEQLADLLREFCDEQGLPADRYEVAEAPERDQAWHDQLAEKIAFELVLLNSADED